MRLQFGCAPRSLHENRIGRKGTAASVLCQGVRGGIHHVHTGRHVTQRGWYVPRS